MPHLYLYFSGTGNTKFAIETFASRYEEDHPYRLHSIEENLDFKSAIEASDLITIAHPIYGSMLPDIMQDFIQNYKSSFKDKTIMVLVTQMIFSGDGARLACSLLHGVHVTNKASTHVNLPNNISDVRILPLKAASDQEHKYKKAIKKINRYIEDIRAGRTPKTGRRLYSRMIGYLFQRVYFKAIHKRMKRMLNINHTSCILCKKCVNQCPVDNLEIANDRVVTKNQCTLCYRCINICPTKSIKMVGKQYPRIQYYKK